MTTYLTHLETLADPEEVPDRLKAAHIGIAEAQAILMEKLPADVPLRSTADGVLSMAVCDMLHLLAHLFGLRYVTEEIEDGGADGDERDAGPVAGEGDAETGQ